MTSRMAVLVDGDNVGGKYAGEILAIAAQHGIPTMVRVYLDAQRPSDWHGVTGYRMIHAGSGKNASDALLSIDAVEMALTKSIDNFAIVSSDRDFGHVAQRLREYGATVTGIGEANTELLQDGLEKGSHLRRFADMNALAADRAAELTNRLLAFSRRQLLHPQTIDVNATVDGIKEMLRRALREDIDIQIVLSDGLWLTEIDPAQIEVALLNLAINSRDAMPNGGILTIKTTNIEIDDATVSVEPDLRAGQYVVIAVSDTGQGIPKDQIARVFEPFFTTKPVGQGTGLGLSMVYGFVKQTAGHIQIYSEVDEGTTINLYFPRHLGDNATRGTIASAVSPQRGEETILVVEDDSLISRQLMAQLTSLGYKVLIASAGAPALKILRARSDVDLLLTDVVLPGGMNGHQIVEAAQVIRPGLKVIFTSGYSQNAIEHNGRLDPDINFLGKPYRRSELAAKVREVLDCLR